MRQHFRTVVAAFAIGLALLPATVMQTAAQSMPDPALSGHGGPIRAIAVLDDTTVVTGGFDSAIIVWDVPSGTAKHVLRRHEGAVTALVAFGVSKQGCFVSGGDDGVLASWCLDRSSPVTVHRVHKGPITSIALWPILTTVPPTILPISASWDHSAKQGWIPDGLLLPLDFQILHKAPINGIATFGGRSNASGTSVVTASYDGEVRISGIDGQTIRQLQLPAAMNGLAVLPDERVVLTAADGVVRVHDADLTPSFEIALDDGPLTAVAVSPDGKTIAVAGMRTPVALIDVVARSVVRKILGPGLPVWALAFSVDGVELFTGGADRALRRWTVATGLPAGEALSKPEDTLGQASKEEGARVFRACSACHTVRPDDGHRAGPTLHGIMGRRIGTASGYQFSEALTRMDIVWSPETIAKLFEVGPNAFTPGTKMPEQRITNPEDRKALVEWLARVTAP